MAAQTRQLTSAASFCKVERRTCSSAHDGAHEDVEARRVHKQRVYASVRPGALDIKGCEG